MSSHNNRLLTVPLMLLVASLLIGTPHRVVLAQEATPDASPVSARSGIFNGLVDIGGRSLHLRCQGEGSPTVILEAGGTVRHQRSGARSCRQ